MLRPSPNHGTQRLPNDDDDDAQPLLCSRCYNVSYYTGFFLEYQSLIMLFVIHFVKI